MDININFILAILVPLAASAQSASVLRPGAIEAGVFAGQALNQEQRPWMYGGNVTYAVNKVIMPYAEFTQFPRIDFKLNLTITGIAGPIQIGGSRLPMSDIHGGAHFRIPIRESRIVPYAAAGFGVLRSPGRHFAGSVEGIQIAFAVDSATVPAVNLGGGIRYYVSQRFGIRGEAKYYRGLTSVGLNTLSSSVTGAAPPSFGKYEIGIFYQFR